MGEYNNPVPIKCWEAYLKFCKCFFDRQDGSHHHWKCPNCWRTITFWGHKKEVPRFHIRTCLKTMGKTQTEFNRWVKDNC